MSHQVCINCLKNIYITWTLARFFLNSGPGIGLKSHCAFLFIVVGFHHCLDYGFHLFYMCRKSKWHKVKRLGAKAAVVRVKTQVRENPKTIIFSSKNAKTS